MSPPVGGFGEHLEQDELVAAVDLLLQGFATYCLHDVPPPFTGRSTRSGISRFVFVWKSSYVGYISIIFCQRRTFSSESTSSGLTRTSRSPTSTVASGLAFRFRYHAGWAGAPPFEAIITKSSPSMT